MKKFKILGLFLCILCLIVFGKIYWNLKYPAYSAVCLESRPYDSETFGKVLAVNDNYLAVGDPDANRVIIYQRQADGNWLRTRKIEPPANSNAHKIGYGFGANLVLNDETLVILNTNNQKSDFLIDRQNADEIYATSIAEKSKLQEIQYPKLNSTSIFYLSFINRNIAFSTRTKIKSDLWKNRIYIGDTNTGEIIKSIEPKELEYDEDLLYSFLRADKNSLIIADAVQDKIYRISKDNKLRQISIKAEQLHPGQLCINSFAISDELIVISCAGDVWNIPRTTSFFQNSYEPSFLNSFNVFGNLDAHGSYVLISYFYPTLSQRGFGDGDKTQHQLVKVESNKVTTKSIIGWSSGKSFYSNGVINNNNLFLTQNKVKGKVVRLPIKNLSRKYNIKQNICRE